MSTHSRSNGASLNVRYISNSGGHSAELVIIIIISGDFYSHSRVHPCIGALHIITINLHHTREQKTYTLTNYIFTFLATKKNNYFFFTLLPFFFSLKIVRIKVQSNFTAAARFPNHHSVFFLLLLLLLISLVVVVVVVK